MAIKKKVYRHKREFLNNRLSESEDSWIKTEVIRYEGTTLDASLVLADCIRNVTIDFGVASYGHLPPPRTLKDIELRRRKIQKLRKHLDEFFDALDKAYGDFEEQVKEKQND